MNHESRVFSPEEIQVLLKAARDILSAAKGSSTKIPILFIGDSPSWIFKYYVALGLERAHPAKQLPVTGHLYDLASPKNLKLRVSDAQMEAYYRKVVLPLFPKGLPALIHVVDYTAQSSGVPWSSVDVLQLFFRAIAKKHYKQTIVPSFHLLRIIVKAAAMSPTLRKPISMKTTLIKMANPPSRIRQEFVFRLADDRYPRGCPKLKREQFEDAEIHKLEEQIKNAPKYQKAIAEIYVTVREMQAIKSERSKATPGQIRHNINAVTLPGPAYNRKVHAALGLSTTDYDRRRPTNEWLRKRRVENGRIA